LESGSNHRIFRHKKEKQEIKVMDREIIENMQKDLINKLMFLVNVKDELWNYHPDNTERIDVVDEFSKLTQEIEDIKEQIAALGE
jgi:hypothetical protein